MMPFKNYALTASATSLSLVTIKKTVSLIGQMNYGN